MRPVYPLNWTANENKAKVAHSNLRLTLKDVDPGLSRRIYDDLRTFVHFRHGNVARVKLKTVNGTRYAVFEMLGFMGFLSKRVNGQDAWVRLWCDSANALVVADTTTQHMLVGQRHWKLTPAVWHARQDILITTQAFERPRGVWNRIGMTMMGRWAQTRIWKIYFKNIRHFYRCAPSTCQIVEFPKFRRVVGNPWVPVNPYPTGGGC